MIRIFTILLISTTISVQVPPGIYFTYKPLKRSVCDQEIKMFVGKTKLCISKKPILGIEEIEYVSDLLYDPKLKVNYISMGLSQSSINTLNRVYQSMPGSEFVLVIENSAIGRFSVEQEINNNREMHLGKDLDLRNLKELHILLKKSIAKKDK